MFRTLRRRKLVQWMLAYSAGAWVLLQAFGLMADSYDWPHAVMRSAIVVAVLGFLLALVLAWYHGERGEQTVSKMELLLLGVLIVIGGGVLWRTQQSSPAQVGTHAVDALIPNALAAGKSIAVLPFESLSSDKDNAYFAVGMQDQILTRLSNLSGLKVISRTSTEKYQSHPENLKQIGTELGVATLLEGSVQKSGNQVRINLQLIDAATDSHLWAEVYDRDLSNVFTVESEVATQVADALKVKLLPAETKRLAKAPTRDPQAYDALLRGDAAQVRAESSGVAADFDTAVAAYREATAHDPQFALAWARLAYAILFKPQFGLTLDMPVAREYSKAAAQRALTLSPGLSEAHVAMGFYYYWGMHDFAHGLQEFDKALVLNPRDATAQRAIGQIRMRQGRLDEAIAAYRRAIELDPRSPRPLLMLVMAYGNQRHYDLADQTLLRMLDLDPANADAIGQRAGHRWLATGDPHQAIAILDAAPASVRANPNIVVLRTQWQYYLRDVDPVRRFLAASVIDNVNPTQVCQGRADVEWLAGNRALARDGYHHCVALVQQELVNDPDNAYLYGGLGWMYARLGRAQDAIREGQRAVDLRPVAQDWTQGGDQLLGMAKIRAQLGQVDAAVAILDQMLSTLHGEIVSAGSLSSDPDWDPIRNDPKFQALLKRYRAQIQH